MKTLVLLQVLFRLTALSNALDATSAFQSSRTSPIPLTLPSQRRLESDLCKPASFLATTSLHSPSPLQWSKKASLRLYAARNENNDNEDETPITRQLNDGSIVAALSITSIAIFYWVYLVFGAATAKAGLPVPDFIPLVPGWPPSDADLAPAIEDSEHFFYIQDLLNRFGNNGAESSLTGQPPVVRLAVFNFAEAWVFAFLPVLLADKKRLPLPAVLFTWVGALGLTNAFLAPYLAIREGFAVFSGNKDGELESQIKGGKNGILSVGIGVIATTVAAYAFLCCVTSASIQDWSNFATLAKEDRTYLAFCADLVLFSVFQPFLLEKVYSQTNEGNMPQIYKAPFVGLMAWLFDMSE